MCGIAGFIHTLPRTDAEQGLRRQLAALAHRGPDGEGLFVSSPSGVLFERWAFDARGGQPPRRVPDTFPRVRAREVQVGMGIRRLAFVDLSGGHAPVLSEDGNVAAVLNGELYNHKELLSALATRHTLASRCDSEALPHLYEEGGMEGVLARIRGMFALALWDNARGKLFLARDAVGIKPLYVAVQPSAEGTSLWWASELKGILADPRFVRRTSPLAVGRYLLQEAVPAPDAIYEGVHKVEAGHYLEIDTRGGAIQLRRHAWWSPPRAAADRPEGLPRATDTAGWKRRLKEVLSRAAVSHVPEEVRSTVLLSGGIDSSLVAALLAEQGKATHATSIGFDEPSFDETPHARTVAQTLGLTHEVVPLSAGDLPALVEEAQVRLDEPLGDGSFVPTLALSRAVWDRGFVAALSGDGGDEIFAGYPTYLAHRADVALDHLPPLLREGALRALERVPPTGANLTWDFMARLLLLGARHKGGRRHLRWMGSLGPEELGEVLEPSLLSELGPSPSDALLAHVDGWERQHKRRSALEQAQVMDLRFYLQDAVLVKVDRASMAHAVEVRVPLLDAEVVRLAFALPTHMRIRGGQLKWILRELAAEMLPAEIARRPKKGFGMPLARWLTQVDRARLRGWLSPPEGSPPLVQQRFIDRLLAEHLEGRRDHRKVLWTLLALRLWQKGPWGPTDG